MTTPSRLLDQVRERLPLKHYSIRTEQAYVEWIKRFIYKLRITRTGPAALV